MKVRMVRTARLLTAATAVFLILPLAGTAAAEESPEFPVTGVLKSEGPLFIDEPGRLLYQVKGEFPETAIRVHDLDTLALKGEVKIGWPLVSFLASSQRGSGIHMRGTLSAVDTKRHRLFYPFRDPLTSLHRIAVIDGRSIKKVGEYPIPPLAEYSDHNVGVEAIDYRAQGDQLFVLTMTPLGNDGVSATGRLFVQGLNATSGQLKWTREIESCESLTSVERDMPPFGDAGGSLYLVCFAGTNFAGTSQVVKMRLGPNGPAPARAFPIPLFPRRGFLDPVSERVFVSSGDLLATFDGAHEAWVGLLVPGNRPQMGINSAIGRVYLCGQSGSGLFFTDAAVATPVPPALAYPALNCTPNASWPMVADGRTARVFAEITRPSPDGGEELVWAALKDPVAAYRSPPGFNPDEGAEDVDESAGRTQSIFNAQGAAFGTSIVWIGGPLGAVDNHSYFVGGFLRGELGHQSKLRLGEGSRELRFAKIYTAKMTNNGVLAAGITADRDNRFESDLETVRQHPLSKAVDADPRWPYVPAECLGFGGGTDEPKAEEAGTSVKCNFESLTLSATSQAEEHSVGIVSIGDSSTRVVAGRDPVRGAFARSTAVARNLKIGGRVFIAETSATVTSWATGRVAGGADTKYRRSFAGVKVLNPAGGLLYQCRSEAECDPLRVVKAINAAFGPRIHATLPLPDPELVNGTPRGTTSSFQQDFWDQTEEQILFDKQVEDLTMAAFELRVGGNLLSTSGYIVKLAGVTASAGYRIFTLPEIPAESEPPGEDSSVATVEEGQPGDAGSPGGGAPSKPKTFFDKIIEKVREGLRWVFGPGADFRSLVAAWALLLAPLYIAVRRRSLIHRVAGG